ncbi:bifunctional diguanylate cyclase/phosphodiesterase [Aureimonas psammosilenae]|uniref:bifunctional diguanylate cyclase/phosphodiesterase n=1 Tax=Aureimonas psammosilenae TaxID=2495496 RepID=UPI001260DFB3|nr:EAL domain-containing protein [Aureimonas psammosilenae]
MDRLQQPSLDVPPRSLRALTLGIACAIGIAGFVLIALIASIGWRANSNEIAAERARIENALSQSVERTLEQQKTIAWWDDAVEHVSNQFDESFADANFGYYFAETFGHDEVYILNGDNAPIYAFINGEKEKALAFDKRSSDLSSVIDAARGWKQNTVEDRTAGFAIKQARYNFLKGALRSAKWGAKITLIDGKPAIIAATTIVPNIDLSLLQGRPYLLVTIVEIDAEFMETVGGSLLISDLRFTPNDASIENTVSDRFVTDDGQSGGYLTWTTSQPGQPLLNVILPLVLIGVVGMWLLSARMLKRLTNASMELTRNEATARHDARHDALSGLPNRFHFVEKVTEKISQRVPNAVLGGLVIGYLDIDRFKEVNDTLGHLTGDELIKQVARRLRDSLDDTFFLARLGGDEFAICQQFARSQDALLLGTVVAKAFSEPFFVSGSPIRVTASLGLARYPLHGSTTEELMRNADIALYVAKRQGRDQAVFFKDEMASELAANREIEVDLRKALANDELDLHFQPLVEAQRGRLVGVEALLRWFHPTKGAISPSTFIPIAEESGMMIELGEWVMRRSIKAAALWPDIEIAVNLSPVQFRRDNLAAVLNGLVEDAGIPANRFTLEITEGLLLENSYRVKETLGELRRLGFRIALDDFGTGFSSLKYLIDFRFDKLKIDRSFVNGSSRASSAEKIIRSIVQLGRAMDMEIVAEGVETNLEATILQALGCHQLQGYFFSRPLSAAQLEEYMQTHERLERSEAKLASPAASARA